jgi:hypothetical protein
LGAAAGGGAFGACFGGAFGSAVSGGGAACAITVGALCAVAGRAAICPTVRAVVASKARRSAVMMTNSSGRYFGLVRIDADRCLSTDPGLIATAAIGPECGKFVRASGLYFEMRRAVFQRHSCRIQAAPLSQRRAHGWRMRGRPTTFMQSIAADQSVAGDGVRGPCGPRTGAS